MKRRCGVPIEIGARFGLLEVVTVLVPATTGPTQYEVQCTGCGDKKIRLPFALRRLTRWNRLGCRSCLAEKSRKSRHERLEKQYATMRSIGAHLQAPIIDEPRLRTIAMCEVRRQEIRDSDPSFENAVRVYEEQQCSGET